MSEKDIPIDVVPILPEDINSGKAGPAPPSYEEVMGQYETSVQTNQQELPSLAYIDIMPRLNKAGNLRAGVMPVFQPFQEIVKGANAWLAQNPGFAAWKIETVERKVLQDQSHKGLVVDLDSMNYREVAWGCNCYVFGIRMWLTQRPPNQSPQEIGLVNVCPPQKEVKIESRHRVGIGFMGLNQYMVASRTQTIITYEGLRKSMEEFNGKVKANPIPGTILNVETAFLKFADGIRTMSAQEVAEMSSWYETSGMTGRRRTQVLRVFYMKGPPTTPHLEMVEFLPTRTGQAGLGRPLRFEDFSDAEDQAAEWLREQRGIQLLNIETREAKYNAFFNFGGQLEIDTDSTDDFDIPAFEAHMLRFLRIFYTSTSSASVSYENTALTSRIFPPHPSDGKSRYETMMQTMGRIDAWLKFTGLPIFGVETIQVLDEGPSAFKKSQYKLRGFSGKSWVTAVKICFAPPVSVEVPEYVIATPTKSSACNII